MRYLRAISLAACAILLQFAGLGTARAQHFDVLVQQVNGQLATGTADFDTNQWYLGRRVWSRDFGTSYAINNPGFNALGSGSPSLPPGSQALPGNTSLSWDFLPMTIDDMSQNLFYWNGLRSDGQPGTTPDDVDFGPLPGPTYILSLFDKSNAKISVDGSNLVVPGGVIDDTASDGSIHRHRFFFLESGAGSPPVDGIHLLSMRLRMVGLEDALPIFMVFGTPGSTVAALDDAAVPWVEQQLDLPGDFNQDGIVDAADYVLWRKQNADQANYNLWKAHFGQAAELIVGSGSGQAPAAGVAAVPEPAAWMMLVLGSAGMTIAQGHRKSGTTLCLKSACRSLLPEGTSANDQSLRHR